MCGIFGYLDRKGDRLSEAFLGEMGARLRHRGPDDTGIFHAGQSAVAVGNQRLSIIDIAHGHQPFVSDDGQIALVQNGEIFNHVELAAELAGTPYACRTHSDTEVLLRLYEKEGMAFLPRLNGMFAIAIWDARCRTLFLARDRVGVKPLYVADDGQRLLFASEIKSILAAGKYEMDYAALDEYFTFNYVPPPRTIYAGIRHLQPGHYLAVSPQGTHEKCWWDIAHLEQEERSEDEWIDLFLSTMEDAVRLRLRSDVPVGAFLSGGVDSSTVVGLMAAHAPYPIQTFCIGFNDVRFDESLFAQQAAERFHTQHICERVDADMLSLWPRTLYYCDQPHGDASFMPTYRVAELAAAHVKVVLTGDGGDELFAGYDKYRDFFATPQAATTSPEEFCTNYLRATGLLTPEEKSELYRGELRAFVNGPHGRDIADNIFGRVQHWDRINQALYLDTCLLLPGNNLVKPDRMGMAVSLEARTPFLDYRMVELAFRIPGRLKLHNGETKYIYKKAVAKLIGPELAYRAKQMFTVPIGEWFKTGAPAEQYGLGPAQVHPALDAARIQEMYAAHQAGKINATRILRAIAALTIWNEGYER